MERIDSRGMASRSLEQAKLIERVKKLETKLDEVSTKLDELRSWLERVQRDGCNCRQ